MEKGYDPADYWAAVDGDRSAVEAIVRELSANLVRIGVGLGLNHFAAEDAAHAAWIKFFEHLRAVKEDPSKALRDPVALPFWLNRVARNIVYDMHRTVRRQRELADRVGREAAVAGEFVYSTDDAERLTRDEQLRAMWKALETLKECRTLLLYRLQDPPLSYGEIAELVDRPEGAIGPTIVRCIDKLRKAMEREIA